MKTKVISSFFVLFAIASGIATTAPDAFADHSEVTIATSDDSGFNMECGENCYIPNIATVDVGGKVIFSNTDSNAHTMTSGTAYDNETVGEKFNSKLIKSGDSWTLDKKLGVGEYPYFCMIHPWMDSLLIVQEAKAEEVVKPVEEVVEEVEEEVSKDEGGGCLIATATFGSELAPQVQQLRELRDNTVLSTASGTAFMSGFNQFYYSFSPIIADYERENPIFREAVKISLTPMLSSLSLLNHVDIDSEQEMLGYGISLILLNVGMYVGIPIFGILKLYQFRKN